MSETRAEYDEPMVTVATELTSSELREVDALAQLLAGKRVAVLTGAGVSTDSGIPDYRGQGSSRRNPMSIDQFVSDDSYRRRYWAGSHRGWMTFAAAAPNAGHRALAAMENARIATGIVTQNVDGLHRRAGSTHVIDLHGSLDRVVCLDCGQKFDRGALADRLARDNPWLDAASQAPLAPDGDVDVTNYADLVVPTCDVCTGMLKPDVVFFGELVPYRVFTTATTLVKKADALLIAGSSLAVNSGFRLVDQAKRARIPVAIINRGDTKADALADVRIDGSASHILAELALRLGARDVDEDIE